MIGIIGGTGLGEILAQQGEVERVFVDTPFGVPSGPLLRGTWQGSEVVFLNRHGPGHTRPPSQVPYRANIFALKQLGVTHIIASGAVGSLQERIAPEHLVVCDQVIDKTLRRAGSFFDEGMAVHVELAEPFCPTLRRLLNGCRSAVATTVHPTGTYVVMEGPQFSTCAESLMHRAWGGDLIGMTCMPEAKLAREAEICYALVALATDYDCWRPHEAKASRRALLAEIIGHLNKASAHGIALIADAVHKLAASVPEPCTCQSALELAIWSDREQVDRAVVHRLEPLLGRYFADNQA